MNAIQLAQENYRQNVIDLFAQMNTENQDRDKKVHHHKRKRNRAGNDKK